MDSTVPTSSDAPAAALLDVVRETLAAHYDAPLVRALEDGRIAVLAGRALERARAAAEAAGIADAAVRIVPLDVTALPWCAVPEAGLRLWRQQGRAGALGELVTEVVSGDPPLQVLTSVAAWDLVRLADGATGWLEPGSIPPANVGAGNLASTAPSPTIGDASIVDVAAFVDAALELEGATYVWGGTTAAGVDCSGLVQRAAWRASSCWLPRHSRALLRVGKRVAPSSPIAGDVLVLRRSPDGIDAERASRQAEIAAAEALRRAVPAHGPAVHPMHVAIALSTTEALHASRDEMRVVRESIAALRARYRVLGVRRLGPVSEGTP